MREAMGNSLLMNLVIIFVSIVILFFVGILSYSKAYRVKNRIIEVIENHGNYSSSSIDEISTDLKSVGYRTTNNKKCGSGNLNSTSYNYCVYKVDDKSSGDSYYFKVVTYVHFEFPIIGGLINIPVKGETKILGKNYNY